MARWLPIALSGKVRKAADRVGGAELILPWPPGLPEGAPVVDVRDATAAEHAAAEQIVGPAARAADLVPVRSSVARLTRPVGPVGPAPQRPLPRAGRTEQHLIVLLIGRRWVHATGAPQPKECWYDGLIERLRRP